MLQAMISHRALPLPIPRRAPRSLQSHRRPTLPRQRPPASPQATSHHPIMAEPPRPCPHHSSRSTTEIRAAHHRHPRWLVPIPPDSLPPQPRHPMPHAAHQVGTNTRIRCLRTLEMDDSPHRPPCVIRRPQQPGNHTACATWYLVCCLSSSSCSA